MNTAQQLRQTWRISDVRKATGLSRTAVYDKGNKNSKYFDPTFPARYRLSQRCVGWDALLVDAWVRERQASGLN